MSITKKIVLLSDFDSIGGTKTYFKNLNEIFIEISSNKNITYYLKGKKALFDEEIRNIEKNNITIKFIPKYVFFDSYFIKKIKLKLFLELFFFLKLKIIGFDKVIVSTGNGQKYLAGSIVFKKNFIFIQHTYLDCLNFDTRGFFNCESIIKNLIINSKFNYLTVSNFSKTYIEKSFTHKSINFRIKVLYNPSNFIDLNILDDKISNENIRVISTFGHLEEYKNPSFWLDTALQILNKFNDVIFIWAGGGTLYNQISNKIPDFYKNRILLIGEICNVEDILKKTSIYFQPSKIESLGISVIDAMAYSIPCITSKCGGLPELVIHNKTGFLIDFNVECSVKYFSLLLNNKNLREKFGQEGRQRVIEIFSITTWKNEILSYINEDQ